MKTSQSAALGMHLRAGYRFIRLSLIIAVICCSSLRAQESALVSDPLAGRDIFESKGCQRCHGIRGQGGNVAVDLGWNEYYGSALELAEDLWNHAPIMREVMREMDVPPPTFTTEEMEKLMLFLYNQRYLKKPGNVLKGKRLLTEKGCLKCHSAKGQGQRRAPRLDRLSDYVSPLFMAQAMWNHGPDMVSKMQELSIPWPEFSDEEIVDLTNYIRILRKDAHLNDTYVKAGNPQQGRRLMERKGCLNCHALDGQGGTIASDFSTLEFDKGVTEMAGLMWNHGAEMISAMKKTGVVWPRFTDDEMADLIAFLYYIDYNRTNGDQLRGWRVFQAKKCSGCHSEDAEASTGPRIAQLKQLTSPAQMAQIMWNHGPKMETAMEKQGVEWPTFDASEMADLYAFLTQENLLTEKAR